MAILRAELKGAGAVTYERQADGTLSSQVHGIYDGIVESAADLALPRTGGFDPGSMLYCLGDHSLYVKTSQNQWEAITE